MRRTLASALVFSMFSMVGLVGCEDKAEVKKTEEIKTPDGGTTKVTDTKKIESTGDNPPPSSSGETAKDAMPPK